MYGEIGGLAGIGSFTAAEHEYQCPSWLGGRQPDGVVVVGAVVVVGGVVVDVVDVLEDELELGVVTVVVVVVVVLGHAPCLAQQGGAEPPSVSGMVTAPAAKTAARATARAIFALISSPSVWLVKRGPVGPLGCYVVVQRNYWEFCSYSTHAMIA